jgi:hypothetical protein
MWRRHAILHICIHFRSFVCKRGNQGGCCQFTPTSFLLTDILKHFLPYLGAFGIPPAARLFLAEPGWLVQKVIQVKPGLGRNWFV